MIHQVICAVDELGRQMDAKWGHGRLPLLCGSEWAVRWKSQSRKFQEAAFRSDLTDVKRHGEAMERAYRKLDEIATHAGHTPASPDVWEMVVDDRLVLLIRDMSMINQVDTGGRKCEIWSLDEIRNVLKTYPVLAAAKQAFPGAEIISTRPARSAKEKLDDDLDNLPF